MDPATDASLRKVPGLVIVERQLHEVLSPITRVESDTLESDEEEDFNRMLEAIDDEEMALL